jgi:hypothetical protein
MTRAFVALLACACAGAPSPRSVSADQEGEGSPEEQTEAPSSGPAILAAHNTRRAEHCAPPLVWSDELARRAQAWADSLRERGCAFEHSEGHDVGENLAAGTSGTLDGEAVTEMWFAEREHFDFRRGGFSMETGHFTQVVWVGTERLGCGSTSCDGMDLWVCNYDPPGNMQGDYRENVLPTSCR